MTWTNRRLWHRSLMAPMLVAVMGGCGGGDDEPTPAATTPVSAVGVISAFGSVVVNGVRFNDSGAAITINDAAATREQLRVGMMVELEGRLDRCPQPDLGVCTGQATRIRFRNNLVGPVTTVNRLRNTLTVMGQTVELDEETIVDGAVVDDIGGLQVGDVVAVSGLRIREQDRTRDRLRARLLQRTGGFVNGTTGISVVGEVTDVVDGTSFGIGPVRVRVQASCGLPTGGVQRGQFVEVTGKAFGAGGFDCDRVQVRERIGMPDASSVELEGYVSDVVSIGNFRLDGMGVNAALATLRDGTAADLANGRRVEVEGVVTDGVLVASRLLFKREANVQLQAPMQSIDTAAGRLALLGKVVALTTTTQWVDQTSAPVRTLSLGDLRVGDRLDVRGASDSAGVLVASRITRTEPSTLLVVKAGLDAKSPTSQLTIFGINALTGPQTRYRDPEGNLISATDFYALAQVPPAVPSVVRAQGVAATVANTVDATRTSSNRGEVEIAR
ncbi:DUF5666 domain-containing protein [Ideonella sp. A 288]|uniref:DUF5666 domain-containing protein n=1 Tax=Ideonella sp. A 288 TaxID=1962181 RepID=UPI00118686DF|nr:DUF5666 domain-containing protein [Ideonella sp. A 288]